MQQVYNQRNNKKIYFYSFQLIENEVLYLIFVLKKTKLKRRQSFKT